MAIKTLCSGEIKDGGSTVFRSVAKLDEENLLTVTFEGEIRIENPAPQLDDYLNRLVNLLPQYSIPEATLDFAQLRFCNDAGFHVAMDICETVYELIPGHITVRRLSDDDWHHETLPILLNLNDESVANRTSFDSL